MTSDREDSMNDPLLDDLVQLEAETRRKAETADWTGQTNRADRLYSEADRMKQRIKAGHRFEPRF